MNVLEQGYDFDIASYEAKYKVDQVEFQPWLPKDEVQHRQQRAVQQLLARKAGAKFGDGCYVALSARIFTHSLVMGDRSWIAAGAIVRGSVYFGADCSVNPYAHIAGTVRFGSGVRIASLASIYGFNHGFARVDVPIRQQPHTSLGITVGDDVWIGANAVIVDGCAVGTHCIVAAGAVVTKSFPSHQIIAGNPARSIRDRRHSNSKCEFEQLTETAEY